MMINDDMIALDNSDMLAMVLLEAELMEGLNSGIDLFDDESTEDMN